MELTGIITEWSAGFMASPLGSATLLSGAISGATMAATNAAMTSVLSKMAGGKVLPTGIPQYNQPIGPMPPGSPRGQQMMTGKTGMAVKGLGALGGALALASAAQAANTAILNASGDQFQTTLEVAAAAADGAMMGIPGMIGGILSGGLNAVTDMATGGESKNLGSLFYKLINGEEAKKPTTPEELEAEKQRIRDDALGQMGLYDKGASEKIAGVVAKQKEFTEETLRVEKEVQAKKIADEAAAKLAADQLYAAQLVIIEKAEKSLTVQEETKNNTKRQPKTVLDESGAADEANAYAVNS